ncbi:MAG: HAD family hydrolase [Nitrospirae bacterium]|nr:HAD family hydrolase [Nitrospirota bacterium]MBF0541682.1 HAD family hydrolase [Nitrospirota bacterium]
MTNNRINFFKEFFSSPDIYSKDGVELLSLSSKFLKCEAQYRSENINDLQIKKIAVLGSYTTSHLVYVLRLFLYKEKIAPDIYEGEFNSINMEILNDASVLYSFKPEILLLLTSDLDIKDYPPLFSTTEQINSWVDVKIAHYKNLWQRVAQKIEGCQILQSLFIIPTHRPLGNLEVNYIFSQTNCLNRLNMKMIEAKPSNVTFIDMDYLASYIGKKTWFDESNFFMSKQGFSYDAIGVVSHAISRIIATYAGRVQKCLVLDLDNTLWGGVIGDDGLEGINLDPNNAVGEAYLAFQETVKSLKNRGVILAVCSKNEEDAARVPFEKHTNMILKMDDIACFIANWNDKASNLKEIAKRLNIGIDSLVFFDDNPAERQLVRQFLREVEVIDVPSDPALYARAINEARCFEWAQLSSEDIIRSDTYIKDVKRAQLEQTTQDYDLYLRSLTMKARVINVGSAELARFTQLINKSNQFNLRTKRYTEAAIIQMMENAEEYALKCIEFEDKFGNYGIISSIILQRINDTAFIDTWVMSCRVLKRGIENAVLEAIFNTAKSWGSKWIVGEYLPTKKNNLVADLYKELGFAKQTKGEGQGEQKGTIYNIKPFSVEIKHFIEIIGQ